MPGLTGHIDRVGDLVDCLEVEPQTFWVATEDPAAPFRLAADGIDALRPRFGALLAHGVSAPVGGSRAPDPAVATLFGETVRRLGAALASEHLSFNQGEGPGGRFSSAFFLPPCLSPAGVDAAVAAVKVLRAGLTVPFSVETPVSYLRPRPGDMADGAFVAEVASRADCGILLDLHNIWANQRNGRQDTRSFVAQLPLERVWEVHLAGGLDRRGYWLDAHSGGLDPALLALAEEVLPQLPALRAVVYEIMPEFVTQAGRDVLRPDLEAVHRLVDRVTRRPARPAPRPSESAPEPDDSPVPLDPRAWEDVVAGLAIGQAPEEPHDLVDELGADPGIGLLQELVHAGRCGRVASTLPLTVGLLVALSTPAEVDRLFVIYAAETFPGLWGSEEGRRFAEWLWPRTEPGSLERAALQLDLAALEVVRRDGPVTVEVDVEPLAFARAVHAGDIPPDLARGRFAATVG